MSKIFCEILYQTNSLTYIFSADRPVMLHDEHRTVYAMHNTSVNLTCSANARPDPTFLWYHEEKHVTENTFNELENSTLTVFLASLHDFGKYKCVAKNAFGSARTHFHIHGGRLPDVPDTFQLLGESTVSLDIEIGAKRDEHFPVLGYRFELIPKDAYEDESSWSNAKVHDVFNRTHEASSVIIHDLKKDTVYLVRAAARNMLGMGEWTDAEEFHTLLNIDHKIAAKDTDDKTEESPEEVEVKKVDQKHQQQSKPPQRPTTPPRIVTIPPNSSSSMTSSSVSAIVAGLIAIMIGLYNDNNQQ